MLKTYYSNSYKETQDIAFEFAKSISDKCVIAFQGDLGAGKTCFVNGFAKGMGYDGAVSSPTFSIVNEYRGGRLDIFHFDMYRIEDWESLYTTGYFDYLEENGILLIEWSENITNALPEDTIFIKIEKIDNDSRKISIK